MCATDTRWMESECRHGGIPEMSSSVQSPLKIVRSLLIRTTTEMLDAVLLSLIQRGRGRGHKGGLEKDKKC